MKLGRMMHFDNQIKDFWLVIGFSKICCIVNKSPYISQSFISLIAEYISKLNYWYFFTKIGWTGCDKKVSSILISFSNNEYRTRRLVYGARKKTKDCGHTGLFINEDLIKSRNKLLLKARKMVKSKVLKCSWSSDGLVLVRDLLDK